MCGWRRKHVLYNVCESRKVEAFLYEELFYMRSCHCFFFFLLFAEVEILVILGVQELFALEELTHQALSRNASLTVGSWLKGAFWNQMIL